MKKAFLIPILITIITIGLANCDHTTKDKIIDNKLNQLLEQKNYFKLRELLESDKVKLSEDKLLYYKAFITKAFGENTQSNVYINVLLDQYKDKFNDTILVKIFDLKATNYLYNYEYKHATEIYSKILNEYSKGLDSSDIAGYKNVINLFGTFANVKPQVKHTHNTVKIASHRNKFNHLMTPVKSEGVLAEFIFDTGANLSTISESQAKKMNLTLFEQNVDVGSSTQINVQSKLAVADSLFVGDILFENVVFLVMPNEQLTFPDINYKIDGIIGFPIIIQLEEVHMHKDGSITVPGKPKKTNLKNTVFEGLNPIVQIFSDDDTLLFTFDTGARNSELSFKYFNDHKSEIERKGELQTNQRGGTGGNTAVKEYMLNNFSMKIGSKSTELSKIPVMLEEYDFNKYFDGNLGQDVFTQFNTLIINFKYMYIDFQ